MRCPKCSGELKEKELIEEVDIITSQPVSAGPILGQDEFYNQNLKPCSEGFYKKVNVRVKYLECPKCGYRKRKSSVLEKV